MRFFEDKTEVPIFLTKQEQDTEGIWLTFTIPQREVVTRAYPPYAKLVATIPEFTYRIMFEGNIDTLNTLIETPPESNFPFMRLEYTHRLNRLQYTYDLLRWEWFEKIKRAYLDKYGSLALDI